MLLVFRRVALPLVIFLAVFFCVGITCAPSVTAGEVEVDQCCDKEEAPVFPVDNGECFDCNCLSCLVILNAPSEIDNVSITTATVYRLLLSEDPPSGFPRLIDYPPEAA